MRKLVSSVLVFGMLAVGLRGPSGAASLPTLVWSRTNNSPTNYEDVVYGVALGASGSVYAAGSEERDDLPPGQWDNWLVRKFDAVGNVLWSDRYNGSANDEDRAQGVVVDASGNAVVAGYETSSGASGMDALTRKYSGGGALLWSRAWDDPDNGFDAASAVAADSSGNVYAAGYAGNAALLLKYDSNGNLQWSRTCRAAGSVEEEYLGVACDSSGNVTAAGRADDGTDTDWVLRRYDPAGNEGWTVTAGRSGDDYAAAVAAESSGDLVVAGVEMRNDLGQGANWVVRRYSPAGVPLWERAHDGPGHNNDFANAVAESADGGAVVAGDTGGGILIRKYGADGGRQWDIFYSSQVSSLDVAYGVALRGAGLAVGGAELRDDLGEDFNWLVLKYRFYYDAGLSALPREAWRGDRISVVLTVTNVGDASMLNTTPALAVPAGVSLLSGLSGPSPSGPVDLAAGSAQRFTWTVLAASPGTVSFSGAVSGTELGTGATAYASAAGSVSISDHPVMAATLWLAGPGAALDRNTFRPGAGESLLVRVNPKDATPVKVRVFTASGRPVRTLPGLADSLGGGQFAFRWDGVTDGGGRAARGIYLVDVEGGGVRVLLKVAVR